MGRTEIIIPYQELLGNYNNSAMRTQWRQIIPYQELLGNYNSFRAVLQAAAIIPYQELLGNYNCSVMMSSVLQLYHTKNC